MQIPCSWARGLLRMRTLPRAVVALLAMSLGCDKKTEPSDPTPAPTPTPKPTRILVLVGSLSSGDVPIGQSANATLIIRHNGNSPLTVTGS